MRPNLLCKLHTALLSTISTFNALVAYCKIVSVELNTLCARGFRDRNKICCNLNKTFN